MKKDISDWLWEGAEAYQRKKLKEQKHIKGKKLKQAKKKNYERHQSDRLGAENLKHGGEVMVDILI